MCVGRRPPLILAVLGLYPLVCQRQAIVYKSYRLQSTRHLERRYMNVSCWLVAHVDDSGEMMLSGQVEGYPEDSTQFNACGGCWPCSKWHSNVHSSTYWVWSCGYARGKTMAEASQSMFRRCSYATIIITTGQRLLLNKVVWIRFWTGECGRHRWGRQHGRRLQNCGLATLCTPKQLFVSMVVANAASQFPKFMTTRSHGCM